MFKTAAVPIIFVACAVLPVLPPARRSNSQRKSQASARTRGTTTAGALPVAGVYNEKDPSKRKRLAGLLHMAHVYAATQLCPDVELIHANIAQLFDNDGFGSLYTKGAKFRWRTYLRLEDLAEDADRQKRSASGLSRTTGRRVRCTLALSVRGACAPAILRPPPRWRRRTCHGKHLCRRDGPGTSNPTPNLVVAQEHSDALQTPACLHCPHDEHSLGPEATERHIHDHPSQHRERICVRCRDGPRLRDLRAGQPRAGRHLRQHRRRDNHDDREDRPRRRAEVHRRAGAMRRTSASSSSTRPAAPSIRPTSSGRACAPAPTKFRSPTTVNASRPARFCSPPPPNARPTAPRASPCTRLRRSRRMAPASRRPTTTSPSPRGSPAT